MKDGENHGHRRRLQRSQQEKRPAKAVLPAQNVESLPRNRRTRAQQQTPPNVVHQVQQNVRDVSREVPADDLDVPNFFTPPGSKRHSGKFNKRIRGDGPPKRAVKIVLSRKLPALASFRTESSNAPKSPQAAQPPELNCVKPLRAHLPAPPDISCRMPLPGITMMRVPASCTKSLSVSKASVAVGRPPEVNNLSAPVSITSSSDFCRSTHSSNAR